MNNVSDFFFPFFFFFEIINMNVRFIGEKEFENEFMDIF